MQVTIEETGALERRMTVQVPAQQVEDKVRERFQHLSRTVRLKGFRPGKVPLNVVRQRYGREVRDEVRNEIMQNSLREAIQQESLRVAAMPSVEPTENDGDQLFEFTAQVEIYPEIDELDVAGISVKRPRVEIVDQDVDDMLKTLQEQRREWVDVERPAADDDRIYADFVATLDDGAQVPAEGRQRLATVIGSGVVFAELEDALRGMAAGESKDVDMTFPDDFGDANLAGKATKINLQVTQVQEGNAPEINDEFAASFNVEGGVEQLRKDVRDNLEREMEQAHSQIMRRRFVDALIARFEDLELPPSLLRQEAEILRQNYAQQVEQAGGDASMTPSVEDLAPNARRRVLAGYLFGELAQRNEVQLDQARVRATVERLASTYDQPQQVVELYYKEQRLLQNVQQQVMEEQIVEWALERVAAEDETMAFSQLIREARNG